MTIEVELQVQMMLWPLHLALGLQYSWRLRASSRGVWSETQLNELERYSAKAIGPSALLTGTDY